MSQPSAHSHSARLPISSCLLRAGFAPVSVLLLTLLVWASQWDGVSLEFGPGPGFQDGPTAVYPV